MSEAKRKSQKTRVIRHKLEVIINRVVNLEYRKRKDDKSLNILNHEVETTLHTVNKINEKTKQLESIAKKQTILTLNATIEATRAGDAGVGFAVVAKQMGDLSHKSVDIYHEIKNSADVITQAVENMNQAVL